MAREILKLRNKVERNPETNTYEAHEIFDVGVIYLSDFTGDGSRHATLEFSNGLRVVDYYAKREIPSGSTVDLDAIGILVVTGTAASVSAAVQFIHLKFASETGDTWSARVLVSIVELALLADFDRDGVVDTDRGSQSWEWGSDGSGAILLVNSDRDTSYPSPHFRDRLDSRINGALDLKDLSKLVLVLKGPQSLDLSGFTLRVYVSDAAASRLRIFDNSTAIPGVLVEPGTPIGVLPASFQERELVVEGLDYPDAAFSGLLRFTLSSHGKASRMRTTRLCSGLPRGLLSPIRSPRGPCI